MGKALLPAVVGHRGAAAAAPENTLESLRLAAEQGAAMVEFDVKLTADGTLILMHDDELDRTTTGHGAVAARRWPISAASMPGAGSPIPGAAPGCPPWRRPSASWRNAA